MKEKPVYLTSDIHLGAVPRETEEAFLEWLEMVAERASSLVLNGDLFDFWFEYASVIPRGHLRVLGALASLVDRGVPILFLGGNHDWWGGGVLREEIGIDFRQEPVETELAGHRAFLAHGDGLGRGDVGYRILRRILRGRLTRWAFRWLHPDVGRWLARQVSQTEVREGGPSPRGRERAAVLEEWAERKLRSDPALDLVVLGHAHLPVLREVEPGRFYLNAGDWIHHRSYAILEEEEAPELRYWEG